MKLLQPLLSWSKGLQQGESVPPPIAGLGTKVDSRFHGRFKIKNRVTLSGEDEAGEKWTINGRGGGMRRLGARIQNGGPHMPGLFVFFPGGGFYLMGGGVVRCGWGGWL